MIDGVGVVPVHVLQDAGFGLGDGRRGLGIGKKVRPTQPNGLAETADVMNPFDPHPVKIEVCEAGVKGRFRMAGQKPPGVAAVLCRRDFAQHGHPGACLRVFQPRRFLDQQRSPGIIGQVPGMVGNVGKQHQRAEVAIQRHADQRSIGPAVPGFQRRRQQPRPRPADQQARRIGVIGLGRYRRRRGCGFFSGFPFSSHDALRSASRPECNPGPGSSLFKPVIKIPGQAPQYDPEQPRNGQRGDGEFGCQFRRNAATGSARMERRADKVRQ